MKYSKLTLLDKLENIPRHGWTWQKIKDLVDTLWRDPVGDRYVTSITFDVITRTLTLNRNHGLPTLTVTIPDEGGGGGGSDTPDTTETPAGDVNDVNTDFTLSQTPVASTLRVYLNGIRQKAGLNFTLATDVITFAVAPFTGDVIIADYKPDVPSLTRVWNETPAGDVDGVNTNFVLLHTPSSVYVYLNGIRQQPVVSYTITGDIITFTDAPFENDVIICDYEY